MRYFFYSFLCSHKCGILDTRVHAFLFSPTMAFLWGGKTGESFFKGIFHKNVKQSWASASFENSERYFKREARLAELENERSEGASNVLSDTILDDRREFNGVSAIYEKLPDGFHDWPLLGCFSCGFLATAANFRLFLNVTILWRKKSYSLVKTEFSSFGNQLETITKIWFFRKNNQLQSVQSTDYRSGFKVVFSQCFPFSCLYFFPGGKHKCLHAKSKYKVTKSASNILTTKKSGYSGGT